MADELVTINMKGYKAQAVWATEKKCEQAIKVALQGLAMKVVRIAVAKCPVKTGTLQRSIFVTRPGDRPPDVSKMDFKSITAIQFNRYHKNPSFNSLLHSRRAAKGYYESLETQPFHARDVQTTLLNVTGEFGSIEQSATIVSAVSEEAFLITIGATAYYAGFVEFGTPHQLAHPFLTPAMNWGANNITRVVGQAIEEAAMSTIKLKV